MYVQHVYSLYTYMYMYMYVHVHVDVAARAGSEPVKEREKKWVYSHF